MNNKARLAGLIYRSIISSRDEMEGGSNTLQMNGSEESVEDLLSGYTYIGKDFNPSFPFKSKCKLCGKYSRVNEAKSCYSCFNYRVYKDMT